MYSLDSLSAHGKVALPVDHMMLEIWLVTRGDDSVVHKVIELCSRYASEGEQAYDRQKS